MRLRRKPWAKPELEKDSNVIFCPVELKGKWSSIFGNDHPIHLELGCGRGNFIARLAEKRQDINFIAIDMYPELLVYVSRKLNAGELKNVRIISMDIQNIDRVFDHEEIERIYINFCNPWPNKRHHKRRLTHPNFLQKYKGFLKDEAEVWFKTDDQSLFQDSLHYFQNTGFTELDVTDNLDQRNFVDHIMTEYEEKFINQGVQIKFARFKHTPNNSGRLDER